MKKFLSILVICCLALTACSKGEGTKQVQTQQPSDEQITLKILGTYKDGGGLDTLRHAEFRKKYPDVKLEYVKKPLDLDDKAFMNQIATEVMAGDGPDLYIMDGSGSTYFNDINKIMQARTFADISPFLSNDATFNEDDYLSAAMDACKIADKQYLMPIGISTPFYMSTKRILSEMGIDKSKISTKMDFVKQMNNYFNTRTPDDKRNAIGPFYTLLPSLMNYLDYSKKTVAIDTQEMREFCEAFKYFNDSMQGGSYSIEENVQNLVQNKIGILFWSFGHTILDTIAMLPDTEEAVLLPTYNNEGKIQAEVTHYGGIFSDCENQQIAYDYLMIAARHSNVDTAVLQPLREDAENAMLMEQSRYIVQEYLPVYKPMYDFQLNTYIDFNALGYTLSNYSSPPPEQKVVPFDKEVIDPFKTLLDDVEVCTIYTDGNARLLEYLTPYFNDETTLDEAVQTAQSAMEIYISE